MWISVAAIKLKHHYRIPCSSFIPISSCLIADEGEAEAFQKEQIVFSTARDVFFLSLFCYRTKCFGAKEKNRARRPIWLPCLRHTQVLRSTSEWKKWGRRAKGRLRGWRVPGSALLRKTSSGWEARESRYNFSSYSCFIFLLLLLLATLRPDSVAEQRKDPAGAVELFLYVFVPFLVCVRL